MVKVKFFASAREIAGAREEALEINDSSTVMDLLGLLANKHGDKLKDYLFDPQSGNPRPYLQFLLNNRSIFLLQGFGTTLTNDCILTILPPAAGG